jgi:hypothetical protein
MKAKPFTIKILKVGGEKASEIRTTAGIILQKLVKGIDGL